MLGDEIKSENYLEATNKMTISANKLSAKKKI
jgi:hypothetical protein